jgi:hypothetical protein
MNITAAKAVASNPAAYSTADLDAALTAIVESDRLTEAQVTNLQRKIDPVLRARLDGGAPALAGNSPAIPDHKFRVVNGRTGSVVLETESWVAAAECQYRNNEAETAVGYDPCFSLWVLDLDGVTTRIQSQL